MLLCILNMCVFENLDNEMSNEFTAQTSSLTSYNMTFSLSLDLYGGIRSLV